MAVYNQQQHILHRCACLRICNVQKYSVCFSALHCGYEQPNNSSSLSQLCSTFASPRNFTTRTRKNNFKHLAFNYWTLKCVRSKTKFLCVKAPWYRRDGKCIRLHKTKYCFGLCTIMLTCIIRFVSYTLNLQYYKRWLYVQHIINCCIRRQQIRAFQILDISPLYYFHICLNYVNLLKYLVLDK